MSISTARRLRHPAERNGSIPRSYDRPRGRRILITGGAGFIACALAERLADDNEVVLFDIRFSDSPLSFSTAATHPRVRRVSGDVRDAEAVRRAVHSADVVIHMASVVGVQNVMSESRRTISTVLAGTTNVLAAVESHPDLQRLVYFSSSEVYGADAFRAHEDRACSIGRARELRWSYSASKLAGEHLVHSYYRDLGVPTVIIRPFNVCGPKRIADHVLERFIVNAFLEAPLQVHGDGGQIRSWCYIEDFCDGVLRTIALDAAIGQDFNLGNPANTVTIYGLAKRVIELLGSRSEIQLVDIDFPDVDIRVPNTEKARRLLGFAPQFELDEAIQWTAAWYAERLSDPALIMPTKELASSAIPPGCEGPEEDPLLAPWDGQRPGSLVQSGEQALAGD